MNEYIAHSGAWGKDPICGMAVDTATAVHVERDGKTFYFCGDHCRKTFLSTPGAVQYAAAQSSGAGGGGHDGQNHEGSGVRLNG